MLNSKQIYDNSDLQCDLCVVQACLQNEVKKTCKFTSDAAQDLLLKRIKSADVAPENKKALLRTPVRKMSSLPDATTHNNSFKIFGRLLKMKLLALKNSLLNGLCCCMSYDLPCG